MNQRGNEQRSVQDIAETVDRLKDELVVCLRNYADSPDRDAIYSQVEHLHGELQEQIGVLKFRVIELARRASFQGESYRLEVEKVSSTLLPQMEEMKKEVAHAIDFLRDVRRCAPQVSEDWSEYFYSKP